MRGQRVGQYVISHLLGRGGMGAVYLAEHELLQRPAAIKMLLPVLSADPCLVDRFFDEAQAVSSINDPGIVQIFDFGYHTDGRAYLVMEYLQGMSLDVRIDWTGALAPQRALRIARQIADSLEAAHVRGVIHRDLKLENVFLVHDPAVPGGERAKILDFGIAKLERRGMPPRARTQTGAILGTPKYMSPEQCRNAHEVDERSDIYALGCLLFCMVTGAPPFDGPSAAEIMSAHLREAPPRPSAVNPELTARWAPGIDAIVARCLAKDPAARYQRMTEVARAISEVLGETGEASAPESRSGSGVSLTGAGRSPGRSFELDATSPTRTVSAVGEAPPEVLAPWRVPAACGAIAALLGLFALYGRLFDGPANAGAEPASPPPVTAPIAAPTPSEPFLIVEPLPPDDVTLRRLVEPAPAPEAPPIVAPGPRRWKAPRVPPPFVVAETPQALADAVMSDTLMTPSSLAADDERAAPGAEREGPAVVADAPPPPHSRASSRSVVFDRLPGTDPAAPPRPRPEIFDDEGPESVNRAD